MTSLCQSRYTQKFLKAHFFDHEPQIRCQAQHASEKYSQIRKIRLTGKRKLLKGYNLTEWCEYDKTDKTQP